MIRSVGILFTIIVTSFYFFPFEFAFLPGVNTKMGMAGLGLVLSIVDMAKLRSPFLNKDFFQLSLLAIGVSLVSFFSITYNDTNDFTYVSYIISMWVWVGASYVVVSLIRHVHGKASVILICNYHIVVCAVQCILAILIDKVSSFEVLVNTFVSGLGFVELDTLEKSGRLYGIGASLDVAGSRFAAVLVMIAFIVTHIEKMVVKKYLWLYMGAVVLIGVVGNMMSRTTTVGLILFIFYLIYESRIWMFRLASHVRKIFQWLLLVLLFAIPVLIYLYDTNDSIRENLRFAFEGFFSLIEKGEWDVHSNEILKNMVVFPDNLKTWFIGDGYLENPYTDPYYVGPKWHGYYMGTDVGYLRFLFYFGVLGLIIFSFFMFWAGKINIKKFKYERDLLWLLLLIHFIIWLKVSTDIFLIFALFLLVNQEENEKYNNSLLLREDNT